MLINIYDVIWEGFVYYFYKIILILDDDNKKVMFKKLVFYVKDDLF